MTRTESLNVTLRRWRVDFSDRWVLLDDFEVGFTCRLCMSHDHVFEFVSWESDIMPKTGDSAVERRKRLLGLCASRELGAVELFRFRPGIIWVSLVLDFDGTWCFFDKNAASRFLAAVALHDDVLGSSFVLSLDESRPRLLPLFE